VGHGSDSNFTPAKTLPRPRRFGIAPCEKDSWMEWFVNKISKLATAAR
jgi:hypothetical protein